MTTAADAANKIDWRKLNLLRQDQRDIANRIGLLEDDLSETKLVTEALHQVDPKRKCFKLEGGVLNEHTVSDVIPTLESNKEQLDSMLTTLKKQLTEKGEAIQAFVKENKIALRKQPSQS